MRFVLPLLALSMCSSAPLRADTFNITLSGSTLSGSGTFTTDGSCVICTPFGAGLLSLTINVGPDSGPDAFDISADALVEAGYFRPGNFFLYFATNSETADELSIDTNSTWTLFSSGTTLGSGTYTVTVPEPSSLFLLMPIVAIVGLRWRHQRHRA